MDSGRLLQALVSAVGAENVTSFGIIKCMCWLIFCVCKRDIKLQDDKKLVHTTTYRKMEWKDI